MISRARGRGILIAAGVVAVLGPTSVSMAQSPARFSQFGIYSAGALDVRAADGGSVTYVPPSSTGRVFFVADAIRIEIVIVNSGGVPLVLRTGGGTLTGAFTPTWLGGGRAPIELDSQVRVRRVGGTEIVAWSDLTLAPQESVSITGSLPNAPTTPGVYAVDFDSSVTDASGLKLRPQGARFAFEVRAADSLEANVEQHVRNASRAILARDYQQAEQQLAELSRLHSRSYVAAMLHARIAEARRDSAQARVFYQQALTLLETNSDDLYARVGALATPSIADRIQNLRRILQGTSPAGLE
jgi:hypothetical protein